MILKNSLYIQTCKPFIPRIEAWIVAQMKCRKMIFGNLKCLQRASHFCLTCLAVWAARNIFLLNSRDARARQWSCLVPFPTTLDPIWTLQLVLRRLESNPDSLHSKRVLYPLHQYLSGQEPIITNLFQVSLHKRYFTKNCQPTRRACKLFESGDNG